MTSVFPGQDNANEQIFAGRQSGGLHLDFLEAEGPRRDPISGLVVEFEHSEHRLLAANSPVAFQVRFAWGGSQSALTQINYV